MEVLDLLAYYNGLLFIIFAVGLVILDIITHK